MCDFLRFFIFHFCEVERKVSYNRINLLERGKWKRERRWLGDEIETQCRFIEHQKKIATR